MAHILAYSIVNDVITHKPIEFLKEVKMQKDIEDFRKPLEIKHKLAEKNIEIDKFNTDPYNNRKKDRYQVLFTIAQNQGGLLHP